MQETICNERVCLTKDLEELSLPRGSVGIVRSAWGYPNEAYEVEFFIQGGTLRLLLLEGQVAPCAGMCEATPSRN